METGFDTKNGRYGAVQKEKLSRKLVEVKNNTYNCTLDGGFKFQFFS